jgi:hypothetical protein
MNSLEKTADQVVTDFAKSGVWMTIPQRKVLWALIVRNLKPIVVEQTSLHFSEADATKNAEQAQRILQLLKDRRSRGATNVELAEIALKYTSRVSELRQSPHNYRIRCERGEGRVTWYFLAPEDW